MSTSSARNPQRRAGPRSAGHGRLVLLFTAALLSALVAGIWIVPGMLDWNQYRSGIASLVSAGIGRRVEINGNITLHLLPQPILTASGLKLADAGDGVAMEAHEVRLRVALGPLLGGRIDARELVLRGADLRLPWPPPPGALSRRPPAWITGLQARVEESRLQVGNLVLSDINATLGADPDTGTLSAAGAAKILGFGSHFTARLGRPGRDGAAPLDLSLDGQDKLRDTGGTFSGVLAEDGGLSGRVAARGPDLSQIMPAPPVTWRAEGRLSASGGLAVADELALEIDGSPARGAVALRIQPDVRLDLSVTAGRIDLDAWTPILLRVAQSSKVEMPTGIDLSAEAASLAGGTLRRLRCAFDVDQSGLSVRDASATLPGDARLSVQGRFARNTRGAIFEGTTQLIAPDLRGTLRWMEPLAPALLGVLPERALRTSNFTAKVAVDPAQLSLTDVKGMLDGAAAQGGVALRLGARPGVSAALALDQVLLDPWLPDPALMSAPASAYAGLNRALASAGFDADVKIQARKAFWRGADFGPLSVDAQTEGTRLTVRRLEVSAAGVHGTVSGTLGDGGRISEGRIELTTQDVGPVGALLPAEMQTVGTLLRGPASMLLQLSGPPEALGLRASAELNDLRFEAQPTVNVPARRWAGPVTIRHPGAPRLLEQLGLKGAAPWLGDGSFSIIAQAVSAPGRIELPSLELIAGQFRGSAQLVFDGNVLTGKIDAETLALPLPYPRSPDPLPTSPLQGWSAQLHLNASQVLLDLAPAVQHLAADLSLSNGTATVRNATAELAGGSITGGMSIETGEKPRVSIEARLQDVVVTGPVDGGTLDVAAGTLNGRFSVNGEGYSPAALAATLAGAGTISIKDAAVTGFDLAGAQSALSDPALLASGSARVATRLQASLADGKTMFPLLQIPFEVRRGVVNLHASASSDKGAAALDGTLDLLGGILEGQFTLRPGDGLPEVSERLSGPALAPVRTPEFAAVARWLAERP